MVTKAQWRRSENSARLGAAITAVRVAIKPYRGQVRKDLIQALHNLEAAYGLRDTAQQ
jgi:hypothetical protein